MGRGGLGVVYEATPLAGGTSVAIKFLSSQWTDDERKKKRFKREGEILARLNHANLLRLYEVGVTDEGQPYLVTELVHGRTLSEVAGQWPQPPEFLHKIALQLCSGLNYAHTLESIIHRDLKPANVLVTNSDTVKLIDFGLAKSLDGSDEALTQQGLLGTPAYMPPEQIAGIALDRRADLYSLGCVLYELIAGRPVFGRGRSTKEVVLAHAMERPAPPQFGGQPITGPLVDITMRCLAKMPNERPFSGGRIVDELCSVDPATCVVGLPEPHEVPEATLMAMQSAQATTTGTGPDAPLDATAVIATHDAVESEPAMPLRQPDAMMFQVIPRDLLADAKEGLTQAFKAGDMMRVPSIMWDHRVPGNGEPPDPEVARATLALHRSARKKRPKRAAVTPTPDALTRKLWMAIGVLGVLVLTLFAMLVGGCRAPYPAATSGVHATQFGNVIENNPPASTLKGEQP